MSIIKKKTRKYKVLAAEEIGRFLKKGKAELSLFSHFSSGRKKWK